jgi:hypothetical protein
MVLSEKLERDQIFDRIRSEAEVRGIPVRSGVGSGGGVGAARHRKEKRAGRRGNGGTEVGAREGGGRPPL